MSSAGQIVGGIVGAVVGFFTPLGPVYGAQIGMLLGGAIDPPKGPTINGPRLNDLSVQTASYGAFIPSVYGTVAQAGNVFWVQGDALIEVQNTTTSGGKGGPSTTTNTWSYYASFAVGLCKGPIAGVRRIWIGNQLWYDAGATDIASIIASNEKAAGFTLYLGTDTQTADPLIQADRGVANVPAYRGRAYIVFDRLPLEKYSNSLMGAQVKVEVVSSGSLSALAYYGKEEITAGPSNYTAAPYQDSAGIHCWQVDSSWSTTVNTIVRQYVVVDPASPPVLHQSLNVTLDNTEPTTIDSVCSGRSDVNVFAIPSKNAYGYGVTLLSEDGGLVTISASVPSAYPTKKYAIKSGIIYFEAGYSTTASLNYSPIKSTFRNETATRIPMPWDITGQIDKIMIVGGELIVAAQKASDGLHYFVRFDLATLAYIGEIDIIAQFVSPIVRFQCDGDGIYFVWFDSTYVKRRIGITGTDELIGTITAANSGGLGWDAPSANYGYSIFSSGENLFQIAYSNFGENFRVGTWTRNLIASGTTTLGTIVQAECLKSKLLSAADLDISELTDTVRGYRVSQLGAIRGALDPLRAAWPFDVVQHGYQLKFKRRGSAPVATIASTELDARAPGDAPGVQIANVREMDTMLPRRVSVNYLDVTREFDTNQQYYERINTDAVSERAVELPIVLSADEAAQKAEALLYLYWLERHDVSLKLPPTYAQLEPADVITVTTDDASYELRLASVNTLPDGRMECAAKYNQAALYTPVAHGEEGQSTGAALSLDGPSVYSLLDIPLMRDDDDTAGFPVAMAGYLSGWPGGVLYRSDDGGQTWADLLAFTPGATIGYAIGSLSAHGGTVYDFASTLTVKLYAGTLASVTEAQLFAGQNWFAYGADGRWEIIAARTATLQGDGSYVLQDFLRGQRGTEWATGLHAANDRIVLLEATHLGFVSVNSSTIGATRDYRAITTGKALDSDASLSFTYAGVNLECLSPVHLTGSRNPSTNDWTLRWVRRSRYDQWRDYVDAPLGETSESYEIDVYASGAYATVKRTLTATSQTVAYTSAQQVADFGSNQATLYLKVYQLSATVGRGYALTQSLTR